MDFVMSIITALLSLFVTLPLCYVSSFSLGRVQSLNESIYCTNWYKFPINYQHYIIMMLMPAQNTHEFTGYSIINCSLETFRKVQKSNTFR